MRYLAAKMVFVFLIFALAIGCNNSDSPIASGNEQTALNDVALSSLEKTSVESFGHIVVANRNGGTISVIDAKTDLVSGTYNLPATTKTPEPMYVVYAKNSPRVLVGDRANNQIVVFNARNFSVENTIPAGAGIWHMWADPGEKQLWVANDIDKTCSVINPASLRVLATVPIPADLAALGGKPHDVILDPNGRFAYVSLISVSGSSDYVVKFSTRTFKETGRAAVGKDPHLSLTPKNELLYVPCQNSNAVFVLKRQTLQQVTTIAVSGAHGAGMPLHGKTFYTTNFSGGGTNGLFAIDTRTNDIIGSTNTPFPVPHNIALTPDGRKLYVTHSGATAKQVTVYRVSSPEAAPVYLTTIEVGLNPFGLAFTR